MPASPSRVALVTGGGRGIGLAAVRRLLNDGWRVAALDVSEPVLASAREQLASAGDSVLYLAASVTDRAAIQSALETVSERWQRLDAVVNNAAVNRPGGLAQSQADWDAVLAVNLTGPFIVTALAAPTLAKNGWGAIVNIGSIGAAGLGASPAYAASKSGLIGLTRQSARELGPSNVTVNYIAPGVILTDWVERNLPASNIEASAANAPLRRVGTPEDIAGLIAFLCSDDARHITGQVISASGGAWMP
jgi:3-oxoacyl-[acyl-carrier protein] reductase